MLVVFITHLAQCHSERSSDEVAASLPIPQKTELLAYLRNSYEALEQFIELLDGRYPNFENVDEELKKKIERIRFNLLVFLTHDCRHLGMLECLKGLQTGFGSATERRDRCHCEWRLEAISSSSRDCFVADERSSQ